MVDKLKMTMSICTFNNGDFDVMFRLGDREVTFSGNQELSDDELDLSLEIAPACVWTDFVQELI